MATDTLWWRSLPIGVPHPRLASSPQCVRLDGTRLGNTAAGSFRQHLHGLLPPRAPSTPLAVPPAASRESTRRRSRCCSPGRTTAGSCCQSRFVSRSPGLEDHRRVRQTSAVIGDPTFEVGHGSLVIHWALPGKVRGGLSVDLGQLTQSFCGRLQQLEPFRFGVRLWF